MIDVFVYGTLTDPEQTGSVLDEYECLDPAVLDGLHLVEGEYPTLAPGGRTEGRLLRTPEVDALDGYEGIERGLYVRVPIPRLDGAGAVDTYVGDPDALGVDVTWPGDGSLRERVERYVRERGVVVVTGEPPG